MKMKCLKWLLASLMLVSSSQLWAHGDVTPQAVDTGTLEPLGDEWLEENPYVGNEEAIKIGASAYNANCARCHGIEAVSGGIAPDLRELENGAYGDEYYIMRARNGAVRNGVTYMPKFEGILSQEAMWAIRAWLETISTETMAAQAGDEPAVEETSAADEVESVGLSAINSSMGGGGNSILGGNADSAEEPQESRSILDAAASDEEESNGAEGAEGERAAAGEAGASAAETSSTDKPTRLSKILAKGSLEVAVYDNFPPYSYIKNGKPTGIDVDIAHELAKRLSVNAMIRMAGADESVGDDLRNNVWKGHYLGGGVADVMLHMPVDSEFAKREDMVKFIAPYQLESLTFAIDTKQLSGDVTLASLTDVPVGVELDTLSDFYLLRAVGGQIADNLKHYKGFNEAAAALKAGEIAAVMGPRGEVEGNLADRAANIVIQDLATPGLMQSAWAMGMAVKAPYKDLAAALQKATDEMVQDGTMEAIFAKYQVTYNPPSGSALANKE